MNHYSAVASSIRRLKLLCQENKHIRRLEDSVRQEMSAEPGPLFFFRKQTTQQQVDLDVALAARRHPGFSRCAELVDLDFECWKDVTVILAFQTRR